MASEYTSSTVKQTATQMQIDVPVGRPFRNSGKIFSLRVSNRSASSSSSRSFLLDELLHARDHE